MAPPISGAIWLAGGAEVVRIHRPGLRGSALFNNHVSRQLHRLPPGLPPDCGHNRRRANARDPDFPGSAVACNARTAMISFASTGPDDNVPRLILRPGRAPLTQHWMQGGQLAGPSLTPQAGLDLRADGVMVFSAAMKPGAQDVFKSGQKEFVADLWKGNVVEWFLGNPKTGRYLEVHLAPTGRWWSCLFASIRVREVPEGRPLPLSVIHHRRDKSGKRWEASVQVPASVLGKLLGVSSVMELRTNFAAVVYPVTGNPLYFSRARLPGPKPNFHQPDAWLSLAV